MVVVEFEGNIMIVGDLMEMNGFEDDGEWIGFEGEKYTRKGVELC